MWSGDNAHWPCTPGLIVKWVSFISSLHWPAGGSDLGVGGISYLDLLIMYELWATLPTHCAILHVELAQAARSTQHKFHVLLTDGLQQALLHQRHDVLARAKWRRMTIVRIFRGAVT